MALITLSTAPMLVFAGNCRTAEQTACTQKYQQETAQCDRYYLQRTEANAWCHDSANQRFEHCQRALDVTCPSGSDLRPGQKGDVQH